MPLLKVEFFDRPCLEVARDLLGCRLVHRSGSDSRRMGRIVEVEAYLGDPTDPASHSFRGLTPRNQVMFGPPGRFYSYLCMGLHVCTNLVCEARGIGSAVLLRAVEPLEGFEEMRQARRGRDGRELTNGPGKLSQAFGITLDSNGESALRGALRLEAAETAPSSPILCSPRIGLSAGVDLPYRFFLQGNRFVSRSAFNRRAEPYRPSDTPDGAPRVI